MPNPKVANRFDTLEFPGPDTHTEYPKAIYADPKKKEHFIAHDAEEELEILERLKGDDEEEEVEEDNDEAPKKKKKKK